MHHRLSLCRRTPRGRQHD